MSHPTLHWTSLGREIPLSLSLVPGPDGEPRVLVTYRDGLDLFGDSPSGLEKRASYHQGLECSAVLPGPDLFLAGGSSLTVLDAQLQPVASVPAPEQEPLRGLLPLSESTFLSYSDDESVRFWRLDERHQPVPSPAWPFACLPIVAPRRGRGVLCLEQGRLVEREAESGRLLKTWPKSPPMITGFGDASGHSLVTIDEAGKGHLWDQHGRERLFPFSLPMALQGGAFHAQGSWGVLWGEEGDLFRFEVAAGGVVQAAPACPQPLIGAAPVASDRLLALDEVGGLWEMGQPPRPVGGTWAGWCTSLLALPQDRTLVGTAHGELLLCTSEAAPPRVIPVHRDAVLALFLWRSQVLSVAADSQVCLLDLDSPEAAREVFSFAGETVVDCLIEEDGTRLWLALEEGKIVALDPHRAALVGEVQLPEHRIEEIRPGGRPGQILVLTDRGSAKRVALPLDDRSAPEQ